jgi:hypothetical protein
VREVEDVRSSKRVWYGKGPDEEVEDLLEEVEFERSMS